MLRKKIGNFYLVELIGTGGMSQVYLALNPRTREKRAIKVLIKRATAPAASYARFLREVEIIRGLCHPNIVRILDSGSMDECYYYAMEFMAGGSLVRKLARGRLPLKEAIDIFGAICDAMAYAHDQGVVHRDLKPANVLVSAQGVPMVSDFGIAKAIDGAKTTLTGSGEIMGTIAYLAPEQRVSTKTADRRADVYALGTLLYEMVMGFPPLGKFPWPGETQPDFPAPIQAILETCLAINPDERFADATLLLFEIKKYQGLMDSMRIEPRRQLRRQAARRNRKAASDLSKSDRIERWFQVLRAGTTRERLIVVREMVEKMEPREAKAILKLYPGEEDRVRWGLIRVLGECKIAGATPLLVAEMKNTVHQECAIEALGKIGADEAFGPIRKHLAEHPESAMMALLPLARTGKQKSIRCIRRYLSHEMAILRQAAASALATVQTPESLHILKDRLKLEADERVRSTIMQSVFSLEAMLFAEQRGAIVP